MSSQLMFHSELSYLMDDLVVRGIMGKIIPSDLYQLRLGWLKVMPLFFGVGLSCSASRIQSCFLLAHGGCLLHWWILGCG